MADLNGLGHLERLAAVRAAFASGHVTDIGRHGPAKVAPRGQIAVVVVGLVGSAYEILAAFKRMVKHDVELPIMQALSRSEPMRA